MDNTFWQERFSKLSAFQKGTLKAKSIGLQRYYLSSSRKAIKGHDVNKAKMWLNAWSVERAFYKQLCGV